MMTTTTGKPLSTKEMIPSLTLSSLANPRQIPLFIFILTCFFNSILYLQDGGPLKYLSTTTFYHSSPDTLRDFYMDNFYRKEWDKTLIHHHQLQIDHTNGTEIGRIVKKFPLLTPREYVLAWRIWQGTDGTYYCYSKVCISISITFFFVCLGFVIMHFAIYLNHHHNHLLCRSVIILQLQDKTSMYGSVFTDLAGESGKVSLFCLVI